MNPSIMAIGIIISILLLIMLDIYRRDLKIKKEIRGNWGNPPEKSILDKIESVREYWQAKQNHVSKEHIIDDITWNDLDMNDVFKRLNSTYTSVGAEYLYAKLHEPSFNINEMTDFEELLQSVDKHKDLREKISFYLYKLGKLDYNNVSQFIFSPKEKRLKNHFIFPVLALIPVIGLLLLPINWRYTVFILVASAITNIFVYYQNKSKLESELQSIGYITSIVTYAGKLKKFKNSEMKTYFDKLDTLYTPIKKISSLGSSMLAKSGNELDFLIEYIKIIFMYDFINYNRVISVILKHNDTFHKLWQEIGKLDSAIAVASYRKSIPFYTTPIFVESEAVIAQEIYHPLLKNPVCNPVTLKRNCIVTGSNASGKSTYVKAVAINGIFAQTIHTCLAESFALKPSLVITSMAVRDNVVDGDSYFIAEIKSLKRILRSNSTDVRCLCFVDEILKGTNTIERIAASASILTWLAEQNCLCIVATHDIEMTDILIDIYDNYHFREQITAEGIHFDYKIYNGWTTTRNAIQLLDFMDYPAEIVSQAQTYAETFETTHKWKRAIRS